MSPLPESRYKTGAASKLSLIAVTASVDQVAEVKRNKATHATAENKKPRKKARTTQSIQNHKQYRKTARFASVVVLEKKMGSGFAGCVGSTGGRWVDDDLRDTLRRREDLFPRVRALPVDRRPAHCFEGRTACSSSSSTSAHSTSRVRSGRSKLLCQVARARKNSGVRIRATTPELKLDRSIGWFGATSGPAGNKTAISARRVQEEFEHVCSLSFFLTSFLFSL